MSGFIKSIDMQVRYLVYELTSRSGYVTLFKGGLALATLALIALQQVFTLALPLENEAYKFKYQIEFETQVQFESIESMECKLDTTTYVKCNQAKQHKALVSSSFDALYTWLKLFASLSFIMFAFSLLGFFAHPYFHKYDALHSSET
ncbi:hypothetical protein QUO11_004633 [Vibrio parahaemolyticus]|nr:hypothetical protein [Vibrio parahaemolyticus]